jgi:hypothetical protein
MFKILFLVLIVMSSAVFSQEIGSPAYSAEAVNQNYESRKIDEFGSLSECDLRSRLDAFLVELMEQPKAKGYIFYYQGENALPSEIENPKRAERLYSNHINFRNFDANRIVLNSSYRKETATELWIVPENAEPPKPTETIDKPKISSDKTLLYDRGSIDFYYDADNSLDLLLLHKRAEYEKFFEPSEEVAEEIVQETNSEETKLSAEELEEIKFDWTSDRFGSFLEKNKKMKGVIIFYADEQEFDIGKVASHIEEGKQRIAKAAKIKPERMQIIFGGYKSYIQIEFWAVPEKGIFPVPKPDERIIEEETETQDQ